MKLVALALTVAAVSARLNEVWTREQTEAAGWVRSATGFDSVDGCSLCGAGPQRFAHRLAAPPRLHQGL